MTATNDRFWAKVLFKEFIRHYRKLNDQQILEDVKQSMDDLDDLNDEGSTFGAKMVKWSMERKESIAAKASVANGASGGRPPSAPIPPPADKSEFAEFVAQKNLPEDIAQDWYALNSERGWNDQTGNRIKNWKGALINYCKKEMKK